MPNNQFQSFKNQLQASIINSGMTFDPAIDCRNDLVNFYGYTRQQVNKMSDDEIFSIMDTIENAEKGYVENELTLPTEIKDSKCDCSGSLKVKFIDCETRGDCEIYVCECTKCNKTVSINYAEEWYVYDLSDEIFDRIIDIDNACFNGHFEKALSIKDEVVIMIENFEGDKIPFNKALNEKIEYLSKRYNVTFNQSEVSEEDTRLLDDVKELSIRSYHCLKRAGYNTVQQVKEASLSDMSKVRHLGEKSLQEIQEVFNIKFL